MSVCVVLFLYAFLDKAGEEVSSAKGMLEGVSTTMASGPTSSNESRQSDIAPPQVSFAEALIVTTLPKLPALETCNSDCRGLSAKQVLIQL
jgi:hypothetical protein